MSDELPTIWEGSAHTFAKHQIIEAYLKAWMPIMSRQSKRLNISENRLLFVDGFAGPGIYAGGEQGSPLRALNLVLTHSHQFNVPVSFLFIEQDKKRCETLERQIKQLQEQMHLSSRIKDVIIKQGDCETILNKYLDDLCEAGKKVGPAFFFLDQFGYSDIPLVLIQKIMKQPQCEVFSYLNWDRMNQFIIDETKWYAISNAFGGDEWKHSLNLPVNKKSNFILDTYKTALQKKAGAKHIWHFAMCDGDDKLIYWLFFCTNKLRGLEEMKKAMWKVDQTGGFRFSDKYNVSQLNLFKNYTEEMLMQELISNFKGKEILLSEVNEFVLTETPACLYKNALCILEKQGSLSVTHSPAGRKKGSFPEKYANSIHIKFSSNPISYPAKDLFPS
jgi:three-Cys-motif partner protein